MTSKANSLLPAVNTFIRDMPNDVYHASEVSWSSSQIKTVLDGDDAFIKKYILKEVTRQDTSAFDIGTYFHTKVLEPHKIKSEVVIFQGKTRYGAKWEEFKKDNPNKLLLTQKQVDVGDSLVRAVKKSPVSTQYLKGEPEISLFIEILISSGRIYAPAFMKILTLNGWVGTPLIPKKGYKTCIRVRGDCVGLTFISDLKSTSVDAQSRAIEGAIEKYEYDLSAALYLDMFSLVRPIVKEFIWIFASKELANAASWRATPNHIKIGRAKYMWGLNRIACLYHSNWEIADYLREPSPSARQYTWLRQQESDADLL